jgi:hypothetical protein
MQQKYGNRFDQQQMQGYCQCRDKGKKSSDDCQHHLGVADQKQSTSKFSNQEEFAIGVMTSVICGKRLGQIDDAQGNKILAKALSKYNFPISLAKNESLWLEAYKDVGTGLEWCKANQ